MYTLNNTTQAGASGISEQIFSNIGIPVSLLTGVLLIVAIVISIMLWAYTSFAWMTISRKLKQKNPGLMWIPLVRTAKRLQLGNFHWALVFLLLIPILGWLAIFVLSIVANWRIFEKRKYPGALSLIPLGRAIPLVNSLVIIGELVVLGLVAWNDQK